MKHNKDAASKDTGLVLLISYILLFVSAALTLTAGNRFFPEAVVLGNMSLSPMWSVILTSGALAVFHTFAIPLVHEWEQYRQRMFANWEWVVTYFVLNAGTLWGVTRFAEQFGVGVSSWMVVVTLALVLDGIQGAALMTLERFRSR